MNGLKEFVRAVRDGNTAVVRQLLAADPALPKVRDSEQSTPLHYAAWKGHAEVIEALLDAGAVIDAEDQNTHYGGTPLHAAAHGNQKAAAERLIARGANVNIKSINGRTALEETGV